MPVIDALLMSWAHTFATTATNIGAAALPGPSAASSGVSATALRGAEEASSGATLVLQSSKVLPPIAVNCGV